MSKTVLVNQSHACGASCGCGKNVQPRADLAALTKSVKAVAEQVQRLCAPTLTSQVETELAKFSGVGAVVNEEAGTVATFLAPKPYFSLSPEERTALETERQSLIESLPRLNWTQRIRASTRIRAIEGELGRDRSGREEERRTAERENERKRQRYGGD